MTECSYKALAFLFKQMYSDLVPGEWNIGKEI